MVCAKQLSEFFSQKSHVIETECQNGLHEAGAEQMLNYGIFQIMDAITVNKNFKNSLPALNKTLI